MPSLGFLKKKKTKDSQGSASDTPKSPVADGGAIDRVLSKNSAFSSEPDPIAGMTSSVPPTSNELPTSPHEFNQANKDIGAAGEGSSHHDSAYSSGTSNNGGSSAQAKISSNQNAIRETKGKYTLTDFTFQRTLGTGSFGRVHLAQSKHNQRYYAVKVLKKAQVVKMKQVEHTNDERKMLQRCRHPFLITLWGTWADSKNLYMVMDFIEGGELFSLLRKSQVS